MDKECSYLFAGWKQFYMKKILGISTYQCNWEVDSFKELSMANLWPKHPQNIGNITRKMLQAFSLTETDLQKFYKALPLPF